MKTRRQFLRKITLALGALALRRGVLAEETSPRKKTVISSCTLYRAINGKPDMNIAKVVELMGGIKKIVGTDDVVS